ncbi:hypothetical protein [Ferrimonas senticii]|uniref:hypothetical protein n=1 Tax=Ferrimonas senticii TaxID=394566 RepID=UPI0004132622|nr:hypothetical protein [Ferrimonas senticii]
MYSDDDLDAAVKAEVISQQSAEALRQFWQQRHHSSHVDGEHFKLVTGFNDIFVVIACVILLTGIASLADGWVAGLSGAATAIAAWLLALFFVLRKKMALPAIALLVAFVWGVYSSVEELMVMLSPADRAVPAGIAAALAAFIHWRTFKVPVTVAVGALALVVGVATSLLAAFPEAIFSLNVICLVTGLGLFAWALWWDFSDRERRNYRSDVAFWLHLIASPLIVHPIFYACGAFDIDIGIGQSVAILLVYMALAVVSLLIDRRAMLVSALVYVISALATLLDDRGFIGQGVTVTGLVLGLGLVALSIGWHRLRALLVKQMPTSLQRRLPVAK